MTGDHLGLRGIDTLEQLAEVKRVPIEIAKDAAVLNADTLRPTRVPASIFEDMKS